MKIDFKLSAQALCARGYTKRAKTRRGVKEEWTRGIKKNVEFPRFHIEILDNGEKYIHLDVRKRHGFFYKWLLNDWGVVRGDCQVREEVAFLRLDTLLLITNRVEKALNYVQRQLKDEKYAYRSAKIRA